jgi:hypothetical protein
VQGHESSLFFLSPHTGVEEEDGTAVEMRWSMKAVAPSSAEELQSPCYSVSRAMLSPPVFGISCCDGDEARQQSTIVARVCWPWLLRINAETEVVIH